MGFRPLAAVILTIVCPALHAQTAAAINGAVVDPSGAPVADAVLHTTDTRTLDERFSNSDSDGRYLIPGLVPGNYRIEVAAPGFRPVRQDGLELSAGYTARVDFRLVIGTTQETIEVRAVTPLLSASPSDWGGVLRADALQSLPLNGRDSWDLMTQQPGVVAPANANRTSLSYGTGARVAINGLRPKQNSFRLDGVQVNDGTGNAPASAAGRSLGLEGIAEIAVITSPFSAEYAHAAGGVIAAVTRSGANRWHGSAYEFLRNNKLDAKNFFDALDAPTPPFRRNQFGGLVSGPIKQNRLFFVLNYEALRESRARTATSTSPPPRAG
ncbi:MAG: TonB-dependent receptor [Acidobacteriota bacterium]